MVTLHVKTTAGKKFTVDVALEATVAETKTALVGPTEVPEAQQRLIFKGKVLKDDQTLASYGIEAENTIFFVKGSVPRPARTEPTPAPPATPTATMPAPSVATPAPMPAAGAAMPANPFGFPLFPSATPSGAATNPFSGMGGNGGMGSGMEAMQQQLLQNPEMMRQMMESPMMQGVLNNPEIMRSMMQSNPQIQALLAQNPQLNHVLNDPELLRQSMEAMRNPAAMREMMRSQDTAMRNIESHPEGFNALRRMYEDVQEPLMSAASAGAPAPRGPAFTMPGVAGSSAAAPASGSATAVAASAAPANPWASTAAAAPSATSASNPWAANSAGAAGAGGLGAFGAGVGGAGGLGGLGMFGAGAGAGAGGAPSPELMAQILQNPLFQPALEQIASNPELFLSQMEQLNPQMATLLRANPQLREQMANPAFLRAALNPQNLQAMMQMQTAMQQLQSTGLMPGLQGLNLNGAPGAAAPPTTGGAAANPFAAFGGSAGSDFPFDLSSFGGAAAAAPAANPEELYAAQLTQLTDMGFPNREQNVRALQATRGNVHAAVERLLSGSV